MAQEDSRWREKYRQAISQQEQLEKTLTAQQQLLHRTVMALTSVGEGHDKEVDKRLAAIRSSLKKNDVSGFGRMLQSIDRVSSEAEKRKYKQWVDIHKCLGKIASQLQGISDSSLKARIKHYKKAIPQGELLPATLKRLLDELTNIQQQAIENTPRKSGNGFLSSLFGSSDAAQHQNNAQQQDIVNEEVEDATWENDDSDDNTVEHIEGELIPQHENLNLTEEKTPQYRQRSIPEAVHERPTHEPAFSKISDRVTIILTELLDHFPVVDCVEAKAKNARTRIDRGLNWYELAPTLEDIRDFVIQSYMGADDNYRMYLSNVYAELSYITESLGLAIESEQQQRLANSTLHDNLSDGMNNISHALAKHDDINELKTAVNSQVHSIQHALADSKKSQDTQQDSLSYQLSNLIDRVKKMEQQDADMRVQLEQEKQRAITDSLTGLPNREAYSAKIHEEMLRWQRYKHPLCLAVLDIDFFKKINDTYGHHTGDKVLKAVSTSVAQRLREVDFMARFGGEEFVILLPETSVENASSILNRTRERLAKTQLRSKNNDQEETKFSVTVSIGIADFQEGDSAEDVFERADKALYDAKENGRNQCRLG